MTSITAALNRNLTGPLTSFEVPINPEGANLNPSSGQRNPSLSPSTAAIGNSDSREPTGNRKLNSCGARNVTSVPLRITQRLSGWRTSPFRTASP